MNAREILFPFKEGKEFPELFEGNSRMMAYGLLLLSLIVFSPSISKAQETFEQTFTRNIEFADPGIRANKFHLLNVNGSITIEATNGEAVELTITKHFEGNRSKIEQAKQNMQFKLERRGNIILAYLDSPYIDMDYDEDGVSYDIDEPKLDYEYKFDVHARVPREILVEGSTMNGNVYVTGNYKKVIAKSLNGNLELKKILSPIHASTLNGNITVLFARAPKGNSSFKTLNGNIDISTPKNLSAVIYFESMIGDFYTDFENFERLNSVDEEDRNEGMLSSIKHIFSGFNPIRIGDGDVKMSFEVLTGNVYLRKR